MKKSHQTRHLHIALFDMFIRNNFQWRQSQPHKAYWKMRDTTKRSVVCNQLMILRGSVVFLDWRKLIVINNGATKQKHHKHREAALLTITHAATQAQGQTMMGKSCRNSENNPAAHHDHLPVLQRWLDSSQTIILDAAISSPQIWTITAQLLGNHTSIVVVLSFFNSLANLQFALLIEITAWCHNAFPLFHPSVYQQFLFSWN